MRRPDDDDDRSEDPVRSQGDVTVRSRVGRRSRFPIEGAADRDEHGGRAADRGFLGLEAARGCRRLVCLRWYGRDHRAEQGRRPRLGALLHDRDGPVRRDGGRMGLREPDARQVLDAPWQHATGDDGVRPVRWRGDVRLEQGRRDRVRPVGGHGRGAAGRGRRP